MDSGWNNDTEIPYAHFFGWSVVFLVLSILYRIINALIFPKARKNQMKYIEAVFLWFFLPYYGWRVVIKNKGDELIEILHTHMKLAEIVYESIPQAVLQIIILSYEGLDDNDVWYSAFRVFSVVISVLSVF